MTGKERILAQLQDHLDNVKNIKFVPATKRFPECAVVTLVDGTKHRVFEDTLEAIVVEPVLIDEAWENFNKSRQYPMVVNLYAVMEYIKNYVRGVQR